MHHAHIHTAHCGTTRQHARRLNRIARDASRTRVVATCPRRQQPERNATERLNAASRIDAIHRLAGRAVTAEHQDPRGASTNHLKRCTLRWPLQTRLRDKHIKWTERRKLLKDAIECTRRASATCGGINDQ